jgi:hypothetical protein
MPTGSERGEGRGPLQLFLNPGIHDELRLTPAQQDQIRDALQEVRKRFRGELKDVRDAGQEDVPEKRHGVRQHLLEEAFRVVAGILRPEQLKRLREIEVQTRGPGAFADPAVQAALGLTEEQKHQIRHAAESARREMQEWFRLGEAAEDEAGGDVIRELKRQILENILSSLSDRQRTVWQELTGAPFTAR